VRSRPILADMSGDKGFVTAALRRHLLRPGVLDALNYPVVSLDVELNAHYGLVVNCWIPLPGRQTDISTKAIHHHGTLLLTTTTLFGPGYEHWLFSRPVMRDPERGLFDMRVTEHGPHPHHHIAFVDAWEPHLPVYPGDLTITLALWTDSHATSWRDVIKRSPILQRYKAPLRALAQRAGLARTLDLNVIDSFDYYPVEDGFQVMKTREEFPKGPNEDHLHSLFHVIQRTGNESLAPLIAQQVEHQTLANRPLVEKLLADLRGGRAIEGRLSDGHHGVPFANFTRAQIERALLGHDSHGR
jgi:hypothetical protein